MNCCYIKKNYSKVADAAIKAMERHLWYLTEELVIFSLFSNRISTMERRMIAQKLLKTSKPKVFNCGRPKFPILKKSTNLSSLIGPNSWYLFELLGVNTDWIGMPVEQWDLHPGYKDAEQFVRHVKVVNDSAERGVKLIQEFANGISKKK